MDQTQTEGTAALLGVCQLLLPFHLGIQHVP